MRLIGYSVHEMLPAVMERLWQSATRWISIARPRAECLARETGEPAEIWDLGLGVGYVVVPHGSIAGKRMGGRLEDTVLPPSG